MPRKPTYPEPPDRGDVNRARALALHLAGQTHAQIAATLGLERSTVTHWLNEPPAKAARESTKAAALERAESLADDAMSALEEIMRGDAAGVTPGDRRAAACAILDRIGLVGGQKVEHAGSLSLGRVSDAELETEAAAILARKEWKPPKD